MKITYNSLSPSITWVITSLILGLSIALQSCAPTHDIAPNAQKSTTLVRAKKLFDKSLKASAARKVSTNSRDIDVSTLAPNWDMNGSIKNSKGYDVLGVLIKKNDDTRWEADFVTVDDNLAMILKKYTKHDGCLTIYNQFGQFLEKGKYFSDKKLYGRFLTREQLNRKARIQNDNEWDVDGGTLDEVTVTAQANSGNDNDNEHDWIFIDVDIPVPPIDAVDNGSDTSDSNASSTDKDECVDADGCGCEDYECKKQKAIAKKISEFENEVNSVYQSIHSSYQEVSSTGEEFVDATPTGRLNALKRTFKIKKRIMIAEGFLHRYFALPVGLLEVTVLSDGAYQYRWVIQDWTLDARDGYGIQIEGSQYAHNIKLISATVNTAVAVDTRLVSLSFNMNVICDKTFKAEIELVEPRTQAKVKIPVEWNPKIPFHFNTSPIVYNAIIEGRPLADPYKQYIAK